ncbi:uncharacterized protein LOC129568029 isoform X2 [Sitodiplosis mosellana]|uniref:uncharacterized protein LOC129568029 isoform X2 n=1 Tax=Sitodiplosis mosellana TaxID=263140 RepID=UPI0024438640|nr:uncharacterized protein LOC129568029 isoform X2 [Sitodiplosis mosellana]
MWPQSKVTYSRPQLKSPYVLCNNARLVCKVMCPIKKGEQIFISLTVRLFRRDELSQKFCQERYHFKCECVICSTDFWLPSEDEINFTNDELYKNVMEVANMMAKLFQELSRERVEHYERSAFKFLEKYDRFHSTRETRAVWVTLVNMWLVLTTRF